MAERRMFAKTIIDSDAFLDMPLSSQALYFHLSMRADDEGFINNPKKIQRMIGASEDDLKVLIAKSFIIPFESGIVVIKHWKIHNYIRGDRLKNTVYEEEKSLLEVKDNGAYTLNTELKEIEKLDSNDKRKIAYHNSSLPYSFEYKIKRAFDGMECPVCNKIMRLSYKLSMPTIQHNLPISKGGKHEIDNISVICESCNTSIRDNETDSLNNEKVIEVWDKICIAEKEKIKWFDNPQILENIDVSQMTDTCQSGDSIGKVRLGKDRIGKDSIGEDSIGEIQEGDKPPKRKRFTPPTLDEVQAYCIERNNNVDPQHFIDYYTSNGWQVGKNKMKDWRAAVRTWERNGYSKPKSNTNKAAEELDDFYNMAHGWAESEE